MENNVKKTLDGLLTTFIEQEQDCEGVMEVLKKLNRNGKRRVELKNMYFRSI